MAAVHVTSRNPTVDGLEVTQGLTWASWRPGGEYTKKVVLKNVAYDKKKIDFLVPHSQVFGTLVYPKAVTLNPGTTYSMPIVFKPLESKQYEDKIEFKTKNKKFSIPIKAILPDADIQIPDQLNFSYCAVKDSVSLKFTIKNLSSFILSFKWKLPQGFSVTPSDGILKENGVCPIEIKFSPDVAGVYDGQAVLVFGDNKWKQLKLEGIGKYPYVSLKSDLSSSSENQSNKFMDYMLPDEVLDFGDVDFGSIATKSLEILNTTNINASFTVSQLNSGREIDRFFFCPSASGQIAAQGKTAIKFTYQPIISGHQHIEYFAITPFGQLSRTIVKCIGRGKGPAIKLSSTSIDFGVVDKVGQSKTLTVNLTNEAYLPAHFQFNTGNFETDSVFTVSPRSGVVKRGQQVSVSVTFTPTHSIGCYRRLQLLINQQDSLFVDLYGVAHCEEFKPLAITSTQISRHYKQMQHGMGTLSPEHLTQLLSANKISAKSGALDWRNEADRVSQSDLAEFSSQSSQPFSSLFRKEDPKLEKFVTLEKNKFDFGRVTNFDEPMQQTLNITNNTKAKVTLAWSASGGVNSKSGFWVEPQVCDIPPLKAQSFRVFFRPDGFDKFFGTQLEAFAFFKVMRHHELVSDPRCVTLPRCVLIETIGHTFNSIKDTFKADMDISNKKIMMPPCVSSTPSYQTIHLVNRGTTSLTFNFDSDPKGHFEVWPQAALILPHCVQICVIKFTGDECQKYSANIQCHVNHNAKYLKTFTISAFVDSPALLVDSNAMVFMKPTCPGEIVQKRYAFRNNSRLPLNFEWRINKEDQDYLTVEPSSGVILPNEIQAHEISLKTEKKKVSHYKTFLRVTSDMTKVHKAYKVQVVCETTEGSLECREESVDFGEVICGNRQTKTLTLFNSSNVNVNFRLAYSARVEGDYEDEEVLTDKPALELSPLGGTVPARTHKIIQITVNPRRRVHYQFDIQGLIVQSANEDEAGVDPIDLCTVSVRGMFPCLQVRDAQCFGAAENMSKVYLWRLLNVDRLNQVLDADPEHAELRYSAVSRMSMESRRGEGRHGSFDLANNARSDAINMNFGSAPAGSPNTKIVLLFENTSHVQTEWNFYFPADLKLELEYWAQSGDFSEEEFHQLMVAENRLFRIHPHSGNLLPGQSVSITLTYQHLFPGTNRIPVLLKLNRGREIVLNFVGVTVEPQRRYLHFASPVHQFRPVPIAGTEPPQQLYELYNGGSVPLKCSLDLSALEHCKADNFNCAIFECLDKELYIEPGKSCALRWIFRPVEAKLYTVEVPVIIEDGETAVIFFEGMGFDKRDIGDKGIENSEDTLDSIPTRQIVAKPRQEVFLSEERVAFGDLPLFTRGRRVVCLTNTSYSDTVKYQWQPNSDPYSKCVNIWPLEGTLGPLESAMFKVTFTSTGFPSFYNLDFTCQVVNSSQMVRYEHDLRYWAQVKAQQDQEFTITEHNVNEIHKVGGSDSALKSVRLRNTTPPLTPSDIDFKHYETLPPIKKTRGDKDHRKSNRRAREVLTEDGSEVWMRPSPPKPFILHLGVTARTHSVQEFEESFGTVSSFFVDRTLSEDFETDIERLQKNPDKIVCLCSEYDLATGIFTSLVKSMFEDTTFHQAIRDVQSEPVPYFAQLKPEDYVQQLHQTEAEVEAQPHTPPGSAYEKEEGESKVGSREKSRQTSAAKVNGLKREQTDVSFQLGEGYSRQLSARSSMKKQPSNLNKEYSGILKPEDTFMSGFEPIDEENYKLLQSVRADRIQQGKSAGITFSGVHEELERPPKNEQQPREGTSSSLMHPHMPATPELRMMERNNKMMEMLKSDAEIAFSAEKSLENCLSNIINEAVAQTFNPVMKPRLIAESMHREDTNI